MVKVTIGKGTFINTGTVFSVNGGGGADISIDDLVVENCVRFLEERDPPNLLKSLGLPDNTPPDYVVDVINALRAQSESTYEERMNTIKESKLWPFFERSSNVMTVLQGLFALAASAVGIPNSL